MHGIPLFRDVNITLNKGEKVALVGPNGSGKTTLLNMLTGNMAPDEGEVILVPQATLGYVPQAFARDIDLSVEKFLEGAKRHQLLRRMKEVGLPERVLKQKLNALSGGEQTKVFLVRAMLADEDIVLLDEPTNYLDDEGLKLLQSFIHRSKHAYVVVSHDREFLDRTVSAVLAIDPLAQTIKRYGGNWSFYKNAHDREVERSWKTYRDARGARKRTEQTVKEKLAWAEVIAKKRRNVKHLPKHESEKPQQATLRDKEGKMTKRAKVLKERLTASLGHANEERPEKGLPLKLSFGVGARSGTKVFALRGAQFTVGTHTIGPVDIDVRYGERILLLGPNGAGKTTLLNAFAGERAPHAGTVERGSALSLGYLRQGMQFFERSTLRELVRDDLRLDEGIFRRLLNRFRLTEEDVSKSLQDLSPGESSRLALAFIMAKKPNCLLLDEPTSSLDVEVLEQLEEALSDFPGTIIAVSHDRAFIRNMRFDTVLTLEQNGLLSRGRHASQMP